MTDWKTTINEGLKSLGLTPNDSHPLIQCSPMSQKMGDALAKILNFVPGVEPLNLQRGLTQENPLLSTAEDFKQQYEFCMMYFGNCYVKEYKKND